MSFPSSFKDNADESIGLLFIKVYNIWHSEIKSALESINITHPQFIILTVLGYLEQSLEHVTQKKISEFSDIDVMTVSQIVGLLEKKKLLERRIHPTDSRAKSVILLDKGKATLKIAVPLVEQIDKKFFQILGDDEISMKKYLKKLLETKSKLHHKNV
ncbi:MarR family winged helix-turn-helix transcriptional regulator [Photorhabdus heterorhabditis]|uniref:MarR family winged helix-turn-helix transcriptional regulator n=1 Tax=Photorhabdus heterorhabditis TaxID=880156 RepID=UPI001BD63B19|nr:MarR family winged helix-turn-helix transcriptional regulator [Photorhabdus heterorhabditis]MBS9443902.1 MarR family transcriptional regulator [Photorhabdus heterorhabditis]